MAPPPPLRPRLCLRGNGKGSFDPPPLFLHKLGTGTGTVGPFTPSSCSGEPPPLTLLRAALRPFTRKGDAGKDANGDHAGPDPPPPFAPPPQFSREWGAASEGVRPPPLVYARAHVARRLPSPSPPPSPFPYPRRPIRTERGHTRARRPGLSPFGRRAQYARKGGTRRPAQPPSLFGHGALHAGKGSTRGHAAPSPSLPHLRGRGAHEGMPPLRPHPSPSSSAVPSYTRGKGHAWAHRPRPFPPHSRGRDAHEGTPPGNPLAASRYARKGLTPRACLRAKGARER
ncbi:hypothetical protein EDB86DRAFT_3086982 [Lactarius hatsudake]|nr:hypothetical protein EDB86DRAFT_3086982 [Lactarius hatsudake]